MATLPSPLSVDAGAASGGLPLVAARRAIRGSTDSRANTSSKMSALSLEKFWKAFPHAGSDTSRRGEW